MQVYSKIKTSKLWTKSEMLGWISVETTCHSKFWTRVCPQTSHPNPTSPVLWLAPKLWSHQTVMNELCSAQGPIWMSNSNDFTSLTSILLWFKTSTLLSYRPISLTGSRSQQNKPISKVHNSSTNEQFIRIPSNKNLLKSTPAHK